MTFTAETFPSFLLSLSMLAACEATDHPKASARVSGDAAGRRVPRLRAPPFRPKSQFGGGVQRAPALNQLSVHTTFPFHRRQDIYQDRSRNQDADSNGHHLVMALVADISMVSELVKARAST